jgi:hypothetical protein
MEICFCISAAYLLYTYIYSNGLENEVMTIIYNVNFHVKNTFLLLFSFQSFSDDRRASNLSVQNSSTITYSSFSKSHKQKQTEKATFVPSMQNNAFKILPEQFPQRCMTPVEKGSMTFPFFFSLPINPTNVYEPSHCSHGV